MHKDEINVEYRDGYLTIRREKKFEHEDKHNDFYLLELKSPTSSFLCFLNYIIHMNKLNVNPI